MPISDLMTSYVGLDDKEDDPETIRLQRAFALAESENPIDQATGQEAISGLASTYEDPGEVPDLPEEFVPPQSEQEGEEGKSFPWGDILQIAPGLLMTGIGAATGSDALGYMGSGYTDVAAGDVLTRQRDEQKLALERRQRTWNDAYEMSKAIPMSMFQNDAEGRYTELLQSKQAFEKDMLADGAVDNVKTYETFLRLQAEFRQEIEDAIHGVDLERARDTFTETQDMQQEYQAMLHAAAEDWANTGVLREGYTEQQMMEILADKPVMRGDQLVSAQDAIAIDQRNRDFQFRQERAVIDSQQHEDRMKRLDLERQDRLERLAFDRKQGDLFNYAAGIVSSVGADIDIGNRDVEIFSREQPPGELGDISNNRQTAEAKALDKHRKELFDGAEKFGLITGRDEQSISIAGYPPLPYPSDEEVNQAIASKAAADATLEQAQQMPETSGFVSGLIESLAGGGLLGDPALDQRPTVEQAQHAVNSAQAEIERISDAQYEVHKLLYTAYIRLMQEHRRR
jgi:hypothetical protein